MKTIRMTTTGFDLRGAYTPARAILAAQIARHARGWGRPNLARLSAAFLIADTVQSADIDALDDDDLDTLCLMVRESAPSIDAAWQAFVRSLGREVIA